MSELDQIRERLEAATPGPWGMVEDTYRADPVFRIGSEPIGCDVARVTRWGDALSNADAVFIASAPTDMAKLLRALDAVEELATYLDTLADGDKHYAALFRDAVRKALEGSGE